MLSFVTAPNIPNLQSQLGEKLAEYVEWRSRKYRQVSALAALQEDCLLCETIPYWRIPRGVDLSRGNLNEQLEEAGWHIQIRCDGRPRYYARATVFSDDWTIDWIGEAWLARAIDDGIDWLDIQEPELPDSTVRLLSSRLFEFSSFILEDRRHVVVSRSKALPSVLPRFTWLSDCELAGRLLDFYGPDYAKGGLIAR